MPDHIDIGSMQLSEGYFLVRPRSQKADINDMDVRMTSGRFCYTYANRSSIKSDVLKMIKEAKKKIFLASFLIGDTDLMEALYEAVRRLRGGVYIITALDENSLRRGLEDIEDSTSSDLQTQKKNFQALTSRGIYVRGHGECHAKFMVIDDSIAIVTSANFVSNAFEKTGECGVIVTEPTEVRRLARFFTRMWYSSCEWEIPTGTDYTVQKRKTAQSPCSVPLPADSKTEGVIWTNNDERYILKSIHDLISLAKKDLIISTFSLNGMEGNPEILINPLQNALREFPDLRVKLLLRSRNHIKSHRIDASILAEMGVKIYADSLNHAKGVIADKSSGAIFSANFDAAHGLTSGVEVGMKIPSGKLLDDAIFYFEYAINNADRQFKLRPTQSEMHDGLVGQWFRRWPIAKNVHLSCTSEIWNEFKSSVSNVPILFTQDKNGEISLLADKLQWMLCISGDELWRLRKVEGMSERTPVLLNEWFNPRREQKIGGLCPAIFYFNEII